MNSTRSQTAISSLTFLCVALSLTATSACTTLMSPPPYRSYPLADGSVQIEAVDRNKETAAKFATDGAEHYCRKKSKEAIYIARPDPVYQGQFDESIVAGVRTAERVVRALGQGESSGSNEMMTDDDDYKAKYLIRCQ